VQPSQTVREARPPHRPTALSAHLIPPSRPASDQSTPRVWPEAAML
jgi:hypothetical protein